MSYILDALRKAERERGITQMPTLMTVHETRRAADRNRLWVISGICLVCTAAIVWFAISFLRTAGAPTPSNSAVAARVPPEPSSSSVQIAPVPSSGMSMPAGGRSPSISQPISTSAPRADVPQTNLPGKKQMDESRTMIPGETQPQTSVGVAGTPTLPAKNASPAATEGTTTAESSPSKVMSLREAMAKMKISVLLYDEARSERMVFINDRKYVEGDYVDGRYLLESITLNGVVLSYQGERAMLRASK